MTIGTRVRIAECSGVDSGKIATVVSLTAQFDGYTRYLVSRGWVPLCVDSISVFDGTPKTYFTAMPKNRLTKAED